MIYEELEDIEKELMKSCKAKLSAQKVSTHIHVVSTLEDSGAILKNPKKSWLNDEIMNLTGYKTLNIEREDLSKNLY